jgi:hypothetical protein
MATQPLPVHTLFAAPPSGATRPRTDAYTLLDGDGNALPTIWQPALADRRATYDAKAVADLLAASTDLLGGAQLALGEIGTITLERTVDCDALEEAYHCLEAAVGLTRVSHE